MADVDANKIFHSSDKVVTASVVQLLVLNFFYEGLSNIISSNIISVVMID